VIAMPADTYAHTNAAIPMSRLSDDAVVQIHDVIGHLLDLFEARCGDPIHRFYEDRSAHGSVGAEPIPDVDDPPFWALRRSTSSPASFTAAGLSVIVLMVIAELDREDAVRRRAIVDHVAQWLLRPSPNSISGPSNWVITLTIRGVVLATGQARWAGG
jgi:hypothetical protein